MRECFIERAELDVSFLKYFSFNLYSKWVKIHERSLCYSLLKSQFVIMHVKCQKQVSLLERC